MTLRPGHIKNHSMGETERILVAMSGGVDSAVAAALLLEAGHDVLGVTLHLWDASGKSQVGRCCAPEDRDDARRVCEHLGIPHYVIDEREAFRREVVEPFLEEYQAGRTPVPCVHCNRTVKLAHLIELADRFGAARVATGHYARLIPDAEGRLRLLRGLDYGKDQSYFLFGVPNDKLRRLVFPLGEMVKDRTREEAHRLDIPIADKADSQELCFVPDGDVPGFVADEGRANRGGRIIDESGAELGEHGAIAGFTVGQRKGLGLGGGPVRHVLRILPDSAEVVVGDADALYSTELVARGAEWQGARPTEPFEAAVRIRYRHPPAAALVTPEGDGFRVRFEEAQRSITPGQAAVIYCEDEVLGGGFIA